MSHHRSRHRSGDERHEKRRRSRSRSRDRDIYSDGAKDKDRDRSRDLRRGESSGQPVVGKHAGNHAATAVDPEEEELKRIEEKLKQEEEAAVERQKVLEESKRRREDILAKWSHRPDQLPPQARSDSAPPPLSFAQRLEQGQPGLVAESESRVNESALLLDEPDAFDMFAENPPESSDLVRSSSNLQLAQTEIRTDAEGYGSITAGRILGGRYQVIGEAGKGVFSTVVRCHDLQQGGVEVVVKVARLNEAMKRAGRKEIEYLRLLTKRDPENKFCVLRMLDWFEDQDFLCVVLEAMDISLRETVYLYGQGQGLSLAAVRYYGKRVLMALYHMKQCGLVHTDLKLDNLLVDKQRKVLKVADFGSTRRIAEFVKGKTEELCPLWYRPPEVIVGYPYMSYSLDIWCFGNILYELATGTVLFQGGNLNEQLKMYMEMFGCLPTKMVTNADAYFYNGDPSKFLWLQMDAVTGRPLTSIVDMSREPHLSLKEKLFDFFPDAKGDERKSIVQLHDLIEKCLMLNPRKRISTEEALNHPFWLTKQFR